MKYKKYDCKKVYVRETFEELVECDICLEEFYGKYAELRNLTETIIICKECMRKIAVDLH